MENRIVQKKIVAIFVLDLLVFAQCLCDSLFRSSRVGQATPETNHGRRLARDDGGHAVQLTSGNFHEFLQNNKYVMVFFVSSPPGKHQIRLSFRCWNPLRRSRFFVWPSTHLVQQIYLEIRGSHFGGGSTLKGCGRSSAAPLCFPTLIFTPRASCSLSHTNCTSLELFVRFRRGMLGRVLLCVCLQYVPWSEWYQTMASTWEAIAEDMKNEFDGKMRIAKVRGEYVCVLACETIIPV